MAIIRYFLGIFSITGVIMGLFMLVLRHLHIKIEILTFFVIIILLLVLVTVVIVLCYLIDDNSTIKKNCRDNETILTTLSLSIERQEENIKWLSKKWEMLESSVIDNLFKTAQDARPSYVKDGSYILTEEGEKALPKDLKKRIDDSTHNVKIKSPEDAFNLLANKIGRDKLKEFAEESKLQFYEIIALSTLYVIKVSKEDK